MIVAVLTETLGWQEEQLAAAAARRGVELRPLPVSGIGIDSAARTAGLRLRGFGDDLPAAVFVRTLPAGSFEQVTRRLSILHALAARGVVVYNDAASIERTIDKGATSLALARAGIDQPRSRCCETRDEAVDLVTEAASRGDALVLKPLFGNRGKGLRLIRTPADLPPPETVAGVYYLQDFVPSGPPASDFRVLVVGEDAVAAMERRGRGWITNRHQGGECLPAVLTPPLAAAAVAATRAVGAAYAGVDLMYAGDGRPLVLEVNGIPAWSGLQTVTRANIAERLVADLLARVPGTCGEIKM